MNKIITLFITAIVAIGCYSFLPENDNALARASRVNGKLVFYHNEPVSNYEVAFTFKNIVKNIDCNTVQQNMNASITNANYESGQQGRLYDALIIGKGSERDIAITFTDKAKDNSITRVAREGGVLLFLGCEPVNKYDIVKKLEVFPWKAKRGKCPSWNDKVDMLLKKSDRKKNNCDAVVIGDTKYNLLIKFE